MNPTALTEEQREIAYAHALEGVSITRIGQLLGFSSVYTFYKFYSSNPEFKTGLFAARDEGLPLMEDKMLAIKDTCQDPKLARVEMECLARVMGYRNPARYGNNVRVDVHQTLDISGSLARIDAQIATTYRDVVPLLEKPNEIKDLL
mgnify:CR=1 FL=1